MNDGGTKKKDRETESSGEREDVPYVVEITPGVGGNQRPLREVLPDDMRDASIKDIVDYFLHNIEWEKAEDADTANVLSKEMDNDDYEITIDGEVVDSFEKLESYFHEAKTKGGKDYRKASFRIASTKRGGYFL